MYKASLADPGIEKWAKHFYNGWGFSWFKWFSLSDSSSLLCHAKHPILSCHLCHEKFMDWERQLSVTKISYSDDPY